MSANTSLPQYPPKLPRILNIARHGRRWFVEFAPQTRVEYARRNGGRQPVTPEVGRAMLDSARRLGLVERVSRWANIKTWHLNDEEPAEVECPMCGELVGREGHYACKWAPAMVEEGAPV